MVASFSSDDKKMKSFFTKGYRNQGVKTHYSTVMNFQEYQKNEIIKFCDENYDTRMSGFDFIISKLPLFATEIDNRKKSELGRRLFLALREAIQIETENRSAKVKFFYV